uniref:DOMON domain-containing protein n=1 Tax=Anopheles culicifacies TaxID=139723 RepID=A0A182MPP6_9DIPT
MGVRVNGGSWMWTTVGLLLVTVCGFCAGSGGPTPQWEHLVDFDPNYRLLWSVGSQEVTFEIQARTLGYVGVGFSRDGTLLGADIAVGWIDQGHVFLQVSKYTIL